MRKVTTIDYERVGKENLKRALARREYHRAINDTIRDHEKGAVILMEVPAENYLEANVTSIKSLIDNGYEGVYMSFQRPFSNLSSLFELNEINLDKLFIIDSATAFSDDVQDNDPRCVNISKDLEIDDMVNTICNTLPRLESDKKFVFIDSLTTLGLHEPQSETLRFPEKLINSVQKKNFKDTLLLFNVAKDLTRRRYIENISVYADEHIHLGLCT